MGISGVLDGVKVGSKCASSGSSALQKSQTLRCSATTVLASVAIVSERNESRVAEAGENAPKDHTELSKFPAAIKIVQQDISRLTRELVDYERIRKVALLAHEFSIDGGELTPTLKVKRKVIDERYGDIIEELYS